MVLQKVLERVTQVGVHSQVEPGTGVRNQRGVAYANSGGFVADGLS